MIDLNFTLGGGDEDISRNVTWMYAHNKCLCRKNRDRGFW